MAVSESVKCRFSNCRAPKLGKYSRGGAASKKQIQEAVGLYVHSTLCGNRCRFSESAIFFAGAIENRIVKTLRWRLLRWRLTLFDSLLSAWNGTVTSPVLCWTQPLTKLAENLADKQVYLQLLPMMGCKVLPGSQRRTRQPSIVPTHQPANAELRREAPLMVSITLVLNNAALKKCNVWGLLFVQ